MQFKVLRGIHSESGRTYYAGSIVDSKSDLLTMNHVSSTPRFQRVESDPSETHAAALKGYNTINEIQSPKAKEPEKDAFTTMTVDELRKFAEETEVDLGKARTRDQILVVLRSA